MKRVLLRTALPSTSFVGLCTRLLILGNFECARHCSDTRSILFSSLISWFLQMNEQGGDWICNESQTEDAIYFCPLTIWWPLRDFKLFFNPGDSDISASVQNGSAWVYLGAVRWCFTHVSDSAHGTSLTSILWVLLGARIAIEGETVVKIGQDSFRIWAPYFFRPPKPIWAHRRPFLMNMFATIKDL